MKVVNFYSHASCEARLGKMRRATESGISTHTPHARRDCISEKLYSSPGYFYSHARCGARHKPAATIAVLGISTHTPHAGRDREPEMADVLPDDFYSHAPCGARPESLNSFNGIHAFLLTRPMRGATKQMFGASSHLSISTHTPHAGRDYSPQPKYRSLGISTHTPHAGRDKCCRRSLRTV